MVKELLNHFLKIFTADESDMMRSSALFGLVELNNHNILETVNLKPLLEMALNDQSSRIREKAKKSLDELKKF